MSAEHAAAKRKPVTGKAKTTKALTADISRLEAEAKRRELKFGKALNKLNDGIQKINHTLETRYEVSTVLRDLDAAHAHVKSMRDTFRTLANAHLVVTGLAMCSHALANVFVKEAGGKVEARLLVMETALWALDQGPTWWEAVYREGVSLEDWARKLVPMYQQSSLLVCLPDLWPGQRPYQN